MRILVLDDDLVRHESFKFHLFEHDVKHVYTAQQAIEEIEKNGPWDLIFLDHDLSDEHYSDLKSEHPGTGYDVATHLEQIKESSKIPKIIVVHSWNPYGSSRMISALLNRKDVAIFKWVFNSKENPLRLMGL